MDGDCKGGVIFRQQLSRNDFLQITDECIPHRFVGISRLQAENNSDVAVGDTKAGVVRVGSFKWLNAGWAKVNMVKQIHIINGIKRFASDFKAVLESPRLPKAQELAAMHRDLEADSAENLRQLVAPYLAAILQSGDSEVSSAPFKKLLASGEYLQKMGQKEMKY